jgi:hypothetical protein
MNFLHNVFCHISYYSVATLAQEQQSTVRKITANKTL